MKNKNVIRILILCGLAIATGGYFLLNRQQLESYFDFLGFIDSVNTYGEYPHTIKSQSTLFDPIGGMYNFYILSDNLPDNFTSDLKLVTDTLLDSGWEPVVTESSGGSKNILESPPGFMVSSGSYTNQFRQNENLLIMNIEAIVAPPVDGHNYVKVGEEFIWNIKVIEIPNYF